MFRLPATHPGDVRSLTGSEMGLAGFELEAFADVAHGGSWHIGVLADSDVEEFPRTYARPGGWRGAAGLYRSMLAEAEQLDGVGHHAAQEAPERVADAFWMFTAAIRLELCTDTRTPRLDTRAAQRECVRSMGAPGW